MIVSLDTCGCVLAIGPDGEPCAFEGEPCARHAGASVADAVAECRAKNAAVAASGLNANHAVWGFDENGAAHVGVIDVFSGQLAVSASSPPLSREGFVSAVSNTG